MVKMVRKWSETDIVQATISANTISRVLNEKDVFKFKLDNKAISTQHFHDLPKCSGMWLQYLNTASNQVPLLNPG